MARCCSPSKYRAKLDADNKPVMALTGFRRRQDAGYAAMSRDAGWGRKFRRCCATRTGNYAAFTADKAAEGRPSTSPNASLATAASNTSYLFTLKD